MTYWNTRMNRPRRHHDGFTLIELLVVIIILGILSAVVVFAVRGVGDKGKANAIAIDERTIRTAMETFCAQRGHYPGTDATADGSDDPMTVLVEQKFLSEPSTYHGVALDAGTEGNCNERKYRFIIDPTVSTSTSAPSGPAVCPQPDSFCDIDVRPTSSVYSMVALPSGKVLGFMTDPNGSSSPGGISVLDPAPQAGHPYGTWTTVTPAGINGGGLAPVVIQSRNPPADDCSSNCGKVFSHDDGVGWVLYDPATNTQVAAAANSLDPGACSIGACGATPSAAQIQGPRCDDDPNNNYCGQVLIVYPRDVTCPVPTSCRSSAELWNPKTMTFTFLGQVGTGQGQRASVVALPDGRALVVAEGSGASEKWTRIFDPATFAAVGFKVAPNHTTSSLGGGWILDNGDVFFAREIFQTGTDTWATVGDTSCNCRVLAALDGGRRVFGLTTPDSTTDAIGWLFDSTTKKWTRSRGKPTMTNSQNSAAVIGGQACDPANKKPYCGKLVTAGKGFYPGPRVSNLYSPP